MFLIIFVCVLFVYIHITNEFKKSNDVTIYETEYINNNLLQDTCELKQPFICKMKDFNTSSIINQPINELKVKDCSSKNVNEYILLSYSSFNKLVETDKKSRYFTENNDNFCNEVLNKDFIRLNKYLRPSFTIQSKYDYIYGSKNACIPLKYHTFSRYFLYVEYGYIRVEMTPWKYGQYMSLYTDYEHLTNNSQINVWKPNPEHENVIKNSHFIEFTVKEGSLLYIPQYWLYSVKFEGKPRVYGITYSTGVNMIVNTRMYCIHYMNKLNSKTSLLKEITTQEEDNNDIKFKEKDISENNENEVENI